MKGMEFATIRDAIASAFSADEFDMFLFERLDFDRPVEVANGPFKLVVSNVLRAAMQSGWDPILIAEVAAVRPLRDDVQDIYRQYAQSLVDEGRRKLVGESQLKAIEKYGLGPRVMVQTNGVAKAPSAVVATQLGLEKTVKPYLNFIDVGLWREQLLRLEGRVCRVEIAGAPIGTGFLVGPDTLLTNYHVMRDVINDPSRAGSVKFRFDYRVLANGTRSEGTLAELHPTDWNVDSSPYTNEEADSNPDGSVPTVDQLDFALVRLSQPFGAQSSGTEGAEQRGWIFVPKTAPSISTNPPMPILILQHPQAEPLKLAVDTAGVLRVYQNGTRLRYATNTEPGSSGSPCFNLDWGLVALHHYGDPAFDKAQYNQGIPINMIRDRLKRQGKDNALGEQLA